MTWSYNPEGIPSVWAPSAFARHYLRNRFLLSFPPLTEMFHFSGFRVSYPMYSGMNDRVLPRSGYPHSDIPGSSLALQLPEAFRSLPRPSSPVGTKAFTVRPYLLHHIAKAVTTSTIPQSPFVTYCIVSLLGMHVYLVFCSCCSTTHFVGKRLLLSNRFLCHADVNFRFSSIDFAGGPDRT